MVSSYRVTDQDLSVPLRSSLFLLLTKLVPSADLARESKARILFYSRLHLVPGGLIRRHLLQLLAVVSQLFVCWHLRYLALFLKQVSGSFTSFHLFSVGLEVV